MNDIEQIIEKTGCYVSTVHGYSMYPLLKNHTDTVYLKKIQVTPKKYDVVLFRRNTGNLVLHRIVKVNESSFTVCGDGEKIKENIDKSQIIAVMSEYVRNDKKHSTKSFGYIVYSKLWCALFHMRNFMLGAYRFYECVKNKIKRSL